MKCNTCMNYIRAKKNKDNVLEIVKECKFGVNIDTMLYYADTKGYECVFYEGDLKYLKKR